jgi:hypothetical protein
MFKLDDIYGDGALTKKIIKKGINTAKPDKVIYILFFKKKYKVSEIIFNLWIYSRDGLNKESLIPHE